MELRKLVKVSAMLAIAAIMQIGGCKLAYAERGYKAFCEHGESFYEDEEEEYDA